MSGHQNSRHPHLGHSDTVLNTGVYSKQPNAIITSTPILLGGPSRNAMVNATSASIKTVSIRQKTQDNRGRRLYGVSRAIHIVETAYTSSSIPSLLIKIFCIGISQILGMSRILIILRVFSRLDHKVIPIAVAFIYDFVIKHIFSSC